MATYISQICTFFYIVVFNLYLTIKKPPLRSYNIQFQSGCVEIRHFIEFSTILQDTDTHFFIGNNFPVAIK